MISFDLISNLVKHLSDIQVLEILFCTGTFVLKCNSIQLNQMTSVTCFYQYSEYDFSWPIYILVCF